VEGVSLGPRSPGPSRHLPSPSNSFSSSLRPRTYSRRARLLFLKHPQSPLCTCSFPPPFLRDFPPFPSHGPFFSRVTRIEKTPTVLDSFLFSWSPYLGIICDRFAAPAIVPAGSEGFLLKMRIRFPDHPFTSLARSPSQPSAIDTRKVAPSFVWTFRYGLRLIAGL